MNVEKQIKKLKNRIKQLEKFKASAESSTDLQDQIDDIRKVLTAQTKAKNRTQEKPKQIAKVS